MYSASVVISNFILAVGSSALTWLNNRSLYVVIFLLYNSGTPPIVDYIIKVSEFLRSPDNKLNESGVNIFSTNTSSNFIGVIEENAL
jgi:hypothetical protein